jgi:hypothetical protein
MNLNLNDFIYIRKPPCSSEKRVRERRGRLSGWDASGDDVANQSGMRVSLNTLCRRREPSWLTEPKKSFRIHMDVTELPTRLAPNLCWQNRGKVNGIEMKIDLDFLHSIPFSECVNLITIHHLRNCFSSSSRHLSRLPPRWVCKAKHLIRSEQLRAVIPKYIDLHTSSIGIFPHYNILMKQREWRQQQCGRRTLIQRENRKEISDFPRGEGRMRRHEEIVQT